MTIDIGELVAKFPRPDNTVYTATFRHWVLIIPHTVGNRREKFVMMVDFGNKWIFTRDLKLGREVQKFLLDETGEKYTFLL